MPTSSLENAHAALNAPVAIRCAVANPKIAYLHPLAVRCTRRLQLGVLDLALELLALGYLADSLVEVVLVDGVALVADGE